MAGPRRPARTAGPPSASAGPSPDLAEPDDDDEEWRPDPVAGRAEVLDDDHNPHSYLYVPDLSSATGWGAHAVPKVEPATPRRPVGFKRE